MCVFTQRGKGNKVYNSTEASFYTCVHACNRSNFRTKVEKFIYLRITMYKFI